MMEAVTLSLGAWLRRCVPHADLSFEDPVRERTEPERTEPDGPVVVRIWLYDVREESRGRGGGMFLRDGADRAVSARMEPLRVLRYSYRLTAHGGNWQARQRVLGDVVVAGAAATCLPDDLVHASFSAFGAGALPLLVAPAEPVPAPPAPPPPSPPLHLVLLAPLRPPEDRTVDRAPRRIDLGARRTDTPDTPGTGAGRRRSVPGQRPRIEERAT